MAAPSEAQVSPGSDTYTYALDISSDTNLDPPCKAILVGTAGTVSVDMMGDDATVTLTLPVGVHKIRANRINEVTASAVVALW